MSEHQAPRPLDRLSSLPNELVDAIFDAAYSFARPSAPLSKRLYPVFERCLYRNVVLRSTRHSHAFSRVLNLHPDRGQLVTAIDIVAPSRVRPDTSRLSLDALLSKLPNLVSLNLPIGFTQYHEPSIETMSRLLGVTKVEAVIHHRLETGSRTSWFPSLLSLSRLPNLDDLSVVDWPPLHDDYIHAELTPLQKSTVFRRVETLRATGDGADEIAVAKLVDFCPELLHLELNSTFGGYSDYSILLPLLPATLRSLRLKADYAPSPCDSFLSHLSQLRCLDLGSQLSSARVHASLAQLRHLVMVRLEDAVVEFSNIATLVSGPSRLVDLASITLDMTDTKEELVGRHVIGPSNPDFSRHQLDSLGCDMADWTDPDDYLANFHGFNAFRQACETNNVKLEGTLVDAHAAVELFYLEWNNRVVLRVWFDRDESDKAFLDTVRYEACKAGVALPPLDLDSLDLGDDLEIVETALPNKDWFVLSLKNKSKMADEYKGGDKDTGEKLEHGASNE